MIRLLIILIIFVSGYGSLFYFFNNAGNLSLVLGMWQLSIPIVQFLFVFITFLVLLILFSYAFTKLFIYPRAAYMRYKLSNEQKGLEHLREALIAITEGNTDQATKSQKQFKKYLTISAVVDPVLIIGTLGNALANILLTLVVAGLGPPIIILF